MAKKDSYQEFLKADFNKLFEGITNMEEKKEEK